MGGNIGGPFTADPVEAQWRARRIEASSGLAASAERRGALPDLRLRAARATKLYAAPEVASGNVIADLTSRLRTREFRRFLDLIHE